MGFHENKVLRSRSRKNVFYAMISTRKPRTTIKEIAAQVISTKHYEFPQKSHSQITKFINQQPRHQ